MATKIKVKRKTTTGNTNVTLESGELYYNQFDNQFFIGDGADAGFPSKHLTQITRLDLDPRKPPSSEELPYGDDVVCFSVGPEPEEGAVNKYAKRIDNVRTAKRAESVVLDSTYFGYDPPERNSDLETAPVGTIYIQLEELSE